MTNTTDKSILTAAGKALLAQLNAEEKPLIIDKMIFANVPNRPEHPQPDDVVPSNDIVYEEIVEQRGRLSVDSVIYSTTLTSEKGPFDFNWTGAYCSEYDVLVTIDHHALTPKTADEPGVAGNTLVRSVVLEYKDIAAITNITVDASSWQYNATPRMKKMDNDAAQAIIDQNGKDWFIEDGFLVTPQSTAYNIKAGGGYVSGNRITLEFDRIVQVPNKPSFIYVDAHREGTPTGEQVTLFDFVITADEKDDYVDAQGINHFVCKIAQVLGDGSISDLRPKAENASRKYVNDKVKHVDKIYTRNFKSIDDLKAGISADGEQVDFEEMIGQKVIWRGYHKESDGGSNWGLVQRGEHKDDGGTTFSVSNDIYVEANLKGKSLNVKKFAAVGDFDIADDTDSIQSTIDYAVIFAPNRVKTIKLPDGSYRTSKPLHVGYGDRYSSLTLKGDGCNFGHGSSMGGTKIVATHSNAMAVNVQGQRRCYIKRLTIEGACYDDLKARSVGGHSTKGEDRFREEHYETPGLDSRAYSSTAPYAGVCVDGYAGPRPDISYPDVAYPDETEEQYNKNYSSTVKLIDVIIRGFAVGVVTHPSGSDGNGDFLSMTRCQIAYCKFGVSIGHTQSRLVNIYDSQLSNCFILLVNNRHGAKKGQFGGVISGTGLEQCGYIMDLQGGTTGCVTLQNCYGELVGSIGDFVTSAASMNFPLVIKNSYFGALGPDERLGVPMYNLATSQYGIVKILGGKLNAREFFVAIGDISVERAFCQSRTSEAPELGTAIAMQSTGGYLTLFGDDDIAVPKISFTGKAADFSTLQYKGAIECCDQSYASKSGRDKLICPYTETIRYSDDLVQVKQDVPIGPIYLSSSIAFSPDNMEITVSVNNDVTAGRCDVGDMICARANNCTVWYVINDKSGLTLKGRRVNGYYKDADGEYQTYDDPVAPNIYLLSCRRYVPSSLMFGDYTSGSNVITNVGRGDSLFPDNAYHVGDKLFFGAVNERVFDSWPTIVEIDTLAKTITVDINARMTRTGAKLPPAVRVG